MEKSLIENNVLYLSDPVQFKQQEQQYLGVRKKEGRIYSDEIVKNLPAFNSAHPLYNEWQIRKNSLQKFLSYLKRKNTFLKILDVGCGNGWIANKLADNLKSQVCALDLNALELEQAARLFGNNPHLNFQYANIFDPNYTDKEFDIVLLASSIQYFSDIQKLLRRLLSLLSVNGEIHIIDSPFYRSQDVSAARERSKKYYEELGFPEMSDYYFHHSIADLNKFEFKYLYDPDSVIQRIVKILTKYKSPFPWIRIKNVNQYREK